MTKLRYIASSFLHYLKANLLVALGVAVATMVIAGSLIIGDSVRYSLEQTTFYRLGETTHLAAVAERYFRQEMATEIELAEPDLRVAPVLLLEGVAVAGGGEQRVNRVQVAGVDSGFVKIARSGIFSELQGDEIIISRNLSERLGAGVGDPLLVRVKKASLIPLNAPFVSAGEGSVSLRAVIKKVVGDDEMGRFNLKTSQSAPYNIFLSLNRLNRLMEFEGRANHLLISTHLEREAVSEAVKRSLTPADAGLTIRNIAATNEVEIVSDRIFLEPAVAEVLEQLPGATPLITYFVNSIEVVRQSPPTLPQSPPIPTNSSFPPSTPYSFVSSLATDRLADNEIILTQWAADDLGVRPGDSITLRYLEIGPLRRLTEQEAHFTLTEVVPMTGEWADATRMPDIPGLADAGHCREWDAGVPIDLDAIREKDEAYWDEWRGAPKAYISLKRAQALWENRFGVFTAVRYPAASFNEEQYRDLFSGSIIPADLGIMVESIREEGLSAARSGTDFSGLFIGLSFFILAAAVILTSLLFRLNLETRSAEVGILSAIGFRERQVRWLFLSEGFVVALAGAIPGILLSVIYTRLVFRVLNTLWFDIVRTNVLLIKVHPSTLVIGLISGLAVSLTAIFIAVSRYQKRKTAELQNRVDEPVSRQAPWVADLVMWVSLMIPAGLLVISFVLSRQLSPMLFFLSGGWLLAGLLLACRKRLGMMTTPDAVSITIWRLAQLNLARNRGRSLTVVTLFALGTFLVISTGSYKLDLMANAQDRKSGTGGFLYFAESTMPLLHDLNDTVYRAEEGLYEDFSVVQFRRAAGDDASCLNLNRISQPAILGVDPEALSGRFSIAAGMTGVDGDDLWQALNEVPGDGTVPAIADQTVIQWGLGKRPGDLLLYQNEMGDTLRIRLVAGTTPSIFQGYIIIANDHFLKNYPSTSGSHIFLIDGEPENAEAIGSELASVFRDYGWEMEPAARRLVTFYSVTNTYLSIFLALGALGMILGTIGLAVILARTILERRREIVLMQAVGFTNRHLFSLLVNEYLLLLGAGVITGFITAVVATLPSFLSSNTDVSLVTVAIITGVILVNGMVWIAGLTWFSLQKRRLVTGLSVE